MIELTKANIRAAIILGMMFGGGIWLSNMVAWWAKDAVTYAVVGRSDRIERAKADAEFQRLIAENTAACMELAKK